MSAEQHDEAEYRHTVEVGPATFVIREIRSWVYEPPRIDYTRSFNDRTSVFVRDLNYPFNVEGDKRAELRAAVEAYYADQPPPFALIP